MYKYNKKTIFTIQNSIHLCIYGKQYSVYKTNYFIIE